LFSWWYILMTDFHSTASHTGSNGSGQSTAAGKGPATVFWLLAVFLILFSVTVGKNRLPGGFICDEAAYFMMTQSLWEDGDLLWTEKDVRSTNRVFEGGPRNVILMTPDGGKTLYYGKPFIYSLLVLPFFAVIGVNGFLLLNSLMYLTMSWLAWRYLRDSNPSGTALLMTLIFFFLTASFPYVFWIHPEVFNMFFIFLGCYFWIFPGPGFSNPTHSPVLKSAILGENDPPQHGPSPSGKNSLKKSRHLADFMTSPPVRAALSGCFLGIAAFSKFPHAAFLGMFFLHGILRRQWSRVIATTLVFAAVLGLLFLGQMALTESPSVYHTARRAVTRIDSTEKLADVGQMWEKSDSRGVGRYGGGGLGLIEVNWMLPYNMLYYLLGRHTGLVPYFFPAVLALYYFLFRGGWKRGQGRVALLLATLALIAFYLLILPFNYQGGGGFIGNRYFASFYPAFLFLIGPLPSLAGPLASVVLAGLFLSQILFTPFGAFTQRQSLQAHVRNPVFRLLPFETTLRWVPSYVDIVQGREKGTIMYRLRFMDLNAYPEGYSFWIRGNSRTAVLLMSRKPLEKIIFSCSGPEVEAWCRGSRGIFRTQTVKSFPDTSDGAGKEKKQLQLVLEEPKPRAVHPFGGEPFTSYFYVVKFRALKGFIPRFSNPESTDIRYLGVRLTLLGEGEPYLGDDYFRASLESIELPEKLVAGDELAVPLRVRSLSPHDWDEKVRISYHWFTAGTSSLEKSEAVVWDGLHTGLPGGSLKAGSVMESTVKLAVPKKPGSYLLQIDLLCDQVDWFASRNEQNSPLTQSMVLVVAGSKEESGRPAE